MNTRRVFTIGALLAGVALSLASVPASGRRGPSSSAANNRVNNYERDYQNNMTYGDRALRNRRFQASLNYYLRAERAARNLAGYLRNLRVTGAGNENVRRGNLRKAYSRQANAQDAASVSRGEIGIQRAANMIRRGQIPAARRQLMRVADSMNRLQRRTRFRGVRHNARNIENRAARGLARLDGRRY